MNTFYFTIYATENEHDCIESIIRDKCIENNIEVLYYRKFKNGHVPMYRECKIKTEHKIGLQILEELNLPYNNYNKND